MDKKSKILLLFIFTIIIISVYLTYQRAFIANDYEIISSPEEEQEAEIIDESLNQ